MSWEKITIVGAGLIGGSLGLAIKKHGLAQQVTACVRRPASLHECQEAGAADAVTLALEEGAAGADLVILCTPISSMKSIAEQIGPVLQPGCLVTDVGSVKESVVNELTPLLRNFGGRFVGSHPMAGSEKTGVQAARTDLFDHTVCAITPTASNEETDVERVSQFWEALGTKTILLAPELHDRLVGRSSHLPHIIASQLVNAILQPGPEAQQQACLCGSGFRDTTRVASGSPEIWRDIALANQRNLAEILRAFSHDLDGIVRLLENADSEGLLDFFTTARDRRNAWLDERADSKPL